MNCSGKIVEDAGFKATLEETKLPCLMDGDLIKKIYTELAESPEYKEYIREQSRW